MPANLIHVKYSDAGSWVVQREDDDAPLSEHPHATAAEHAAHVHAAGCDASHVLIHDRYSRVRVAPLRR